jgi:hypothetical protein
MLNADGLLSLGCRYDDEAVPEDDDDLHDFEYYDSSTARAAAFVESLGLAPEINNKNGYGELNGVYEDHDRRAENSRRRHLGEQGFGKEAPASKHRRPGPAAVQAV